MDDQRRCTYPCKSDATAPKRVSGVVRMSYERPESSIVNFALVLRIAFECLARRLRNGLHEKTDHKHPNAGPLLPTQRGGEAACESGNGVADRRHGADCIERVDEEVVQHDLGGLGHWPFVGVCECDPIDLGQGVSFVIFYESGLRYLAESGNRIHPCQKSGYGTQTSYTRTRRHQDAIRTYTKGRRGADGQSTAE